MRRAKVGPNNNHNNSNNNSRRILPKSLRIIGSCIKTVSANATSVASTVKFAAASISSVASDHHKEQVTWAGFDKLELSSAICRHVLLLGYQNGFQVVDVDDASNFSELVSRRDEGPVTFLQIQPIPLRLNNEEGIGKSHPLLLVVGWEDESNPSGPVGLENDKHTVPNAGNLISCPRAVRFYSLRSHCYVHVLRFRSTVCMVRCSPRIVAVGLEEQIYCFDALTLENKFSVLTYPVPQLEGQGKVGINIGYGPMAVGTRWLAYASNDPFLVNTGRLSPQVLSPSPGASSSTSPVSGGVVAHYAVESGKHLAAGIVNLSDKGYKTLSKYYQELLPDGPDTSVRSRSRTDSRGESESNNAGVVVVKDFISRAVICQFRAHTTPISALCFDPSGTLLVTASVHGNTINIFRIMPCRNKCGAGSESYDWSSSCVHLYKFHRGIRAAIIQDISFSRYSQWIAVVSSKGTCHVFVLSPFGGDVGFQNLNGQNEEPSISPVLTLPWWSSPTCNLNQKSVLPPPPVTLSVLTRIKDNKAGFLNTVSNAAASMSKKVAVPSGALAAVFHNSIPCSPNQAQTAVRSLEHILVYTPSGHVVQHEIQPSFGLDSDGDSKSHSSFFIPSQDRELNININPVQWWDVCRRANWPEREDVITDSVVHKQQARDVSRNPISGTYIPDLSQRSRSAGRFKSMKMDSSSYEEISHWYLSNVEVQYNSGKLRVWQKSKISFCMIVPQQNQDYANGEHEIERLPVSDVEIRRKDLLPVYDHFHSMKSVFYDRGASAGKYLTSFGSESPHTTDKAAEETIICHSKPASFSSTDSSDGGSSRRIEYLLDLDHLNSEQSYMPYYQNTNGCSPEKLETGRSKLSLLDNKRRGTASEPSDSSRHNCLIEVISVEPNEVRASESHSSSSGVVKSEQTPLSDMNWQNEVPEHNGDASHVHGDGSISSKIHDSVGNGMLFKNAFCKKLVPGVNPSQTEDMNNAALRCSLDSHKENLNQEIDLPCLVFSSIEKDGEKTNEVEGLEATVVMSDDAAASSDTTFGKGKRVDEEQNKSGPLYYHLDLNGSIMESAEGQIGTVSASNAAISCNTSSFEGRLTQEDYLFGVMFPISRGLETSEPAWGQRTSETASAAEVSRSNSRKNGFNQEAPKMLGGMFASFDDSDMALEPVAGQQECEAFTAGRINYANFPEVQYSQQVEDMFQGICAPSEEGGVMTKPVGCQMATEAASLSAPGSTNSSIKDQSNQEEDENMFGGIFSLLVEPRETFESAGCQKVTKVVVSNVSVSGTINCRKDDLDHEEDNMLGSLFPSEENVAVSGAINCRKDNLDDEEDNMLGSLFPSAEECPNDAQCFSRRHDLDEEEDDTLGAIFPFSEECVSDAQSFSSKDGLDEEKKDMFEALFPFSGEG